MKYRPIVFDCDGVLVDSEALGWEAMAAALGKYSISLDQSDIRLLTGASFEADYAHFAQRGDLPGSEEFWQELTDEMFVLFDRKLQAFEDARDTLEALAERGMTIAVASNSPTDRLKRSLAATGLDEFFAIAVSADEVGRPKPAPDLYLEAAARLGVPAEACVAVEDTAPGAAAAIAAGMWTVVVDRGDLELGSVVPDAIVPRLTPASVMLAAVPTA